MVTLSALFGWFIARCIVNPLQRAVQSAWRIAEGDLRVVVVAEGCDETAKLLQAVSRMHASLRQVVGQVRTGVDSLTTGSAQIAAGNQDLVAVSTPATAAPAAQEPAAEHAAD